MNDSETIRLLEKYFSPEDWQYLNQNGTFKERLAESNGSLENYEELAEIGALLLRQRGEMGGEKS